MKVYFDPNISFNELIDYYAPIIIDINGKKFIDLHSMSIINLLGISYSFNTTEEMFGMIFSVFEFDNTNIDIPTDNLIELNEENFEKFKISNLISLQQMYQMAFPGQYILKLENTPNNLEFLVSLCPQYVLDKKEYFQNKEFEILLEMVIFLELKKFAERTNVDFSMPQPFIFIFDLSKVSLEKAHILIDEIQKLNKILTNKVDAIYEYAKDKIKALEKLFQSIDRKSFSKLLYIFASIDDIISDLQVLKNLLSEIEKIE